MGKNTSAATSDFTSRLHAERDALKAFVTLLETEQQALLSGNTEQLLALADSKILAAHELSKLATARSDGLRARGGKVMPTQMIFNSFDGLRVRGGKIELGGMTAWLQANAASSLPVWQDILQLAEQSQQLNRTNGVLIQTKLRHNQQALMALQNAVHSTNGLYGPDGQPNLSASGRTLGSV